MPEPFRDLGHDISEIEAGRWTAIGPEDDRVVHAGEEDVAMETAKRSSGRAPGTEPYVPLDEIADRSGNPEDILIAREEAEMEPEEGGDDIIDVDEELVRGTREADEEREKLGDVLQDTQDETAKRIHLSEQRRLGKEQREIDPRMGRILKQGRSQGKKGTGERPEQTPKYKTEPTHLRVE